MPNFTKRHPDTSYATKYPYNRVTVTESGHELHWDDTKGHERIRFGHQTGSYFEMSPEGRRVDMTVGHKVEYAKGGVTFTSDRNVDYKVHGSDRESIGGHKHQEVLGDYTSTIGLDRKQITGRHATTLVGGDTTHATVGQHLEHVGGLYRRKHDSSAEIFTTGDIWHQASGVHTIEAATVIIKAASIILESGDVRIGEASAPFPVMTVAGPSTVAKAI